VVALTISRRGSLFRVRAIDQSDGEEAEVYGVKATNEALSFAAYWSSGQFTKYRLCPLWPDQMLVTFTYTATQTFKRESVRASKARIRAEKALLHKS
jgi:hypothetical protein